jgi:hypothetical protein
LDLPTRKSIHRSFLESNTAVQKRYFPDRALLFPEPDKIPDNGEALSEDGHRALDQVLELVGRKGRDVLAPEAVKDAQHLIREIYLGNTGIPFSWLHVNLFGKGILRVDDDGMLHAPVVIRNTSSETLELSTSRECHYSIGWQVRDEAGAPLENLHGTVKVEQTIPSGTFRQTTVSFPMNFDDLRSQRAVGIEFCLVDGEKWINEKHPLNSAWSIVFLNSSIDGNS